ncbi:factor activating pos9 [Ceratobasidium sp. UAMH 11750]|nr:factor activating pos9 [Ceratobasidium sp. UAMH 11750]
MSDTDEHPPRQFPIIVITGTPGTGKSTHAQLVAEQSTVQMRHVNVGELVKEKGLHEGFDEEWQSYIVDEDKVSWCFAFFEGMLTSG